MVLRSLDINNAKNIYSFLKGSNADHLKRYQEKNTSSNQPQQIQLSTYGGNLLTLKYNSIAVRDHLAIHIIQA